MVVPYALFILLAATSGAYSSAGSVPSTPTEFPVYPDLFNPSTNTSIGQMTQLDILILLNKNGTLNVPLVRSLLEKQQLGSVLNNPRNAAGQHPYSVDEYRTLMETLYNLSSTIGARIPIVYGLDSVHGANYIFNATLFPQQFGAAATFNTTKVHEMGYVAGLETRYAGVPWAFAPILGIGVQPSWPRMYETFGEDPHLVAEMARAIITGLQSKPPANLEGNFSVNVAATMKHFIGFTNPRTGQDLAPVWLPMNYLLQYFAPSFQAAIDAGVMSCMENEIEVNGRPVVASKLLLTELLRDVMKFKGMLVTDYGEIYNLVTGHRAARSKHDAVAMALNGTTIDMSMVALTLDFPEILRDVIDQGRVSEARVQTSAGRVMDMKRKLGLLNGSPVPKLKYGCAFGCPEHRQQALDTVRESVTLLQNDGVLPLTGISKELDVIGVVGQACDSIPLMAGGWTVKWQGTNNASYFPYGSTIRQELLARGYNVLYAQGCNVTEGSVCGEDHIQAAVSVAARSKVTIVCVGETHYAEMDGNIDNITLPGQQIDMVRRLATASSNLVTVLIEGRPRILDDIPRLSRAVLMGYLPGPFGGQGIVDILLGDVSPSGRLSITYPRTANNAPLQYWRKWTATYTPQWPFGHGMSYATFAYSALNATFDTNDGNFHVVLNVTNTGTVPARDAVLVYATQQYRSITPEVKMLRGFTKVMLAPGETTQVKLQVPFDAFAYYDEYNCKVVEKGVVEFSVGNQTSFSAIPVGFRFNCEAWGMYASRHDGVNGVVPPPPSKHASSTPDYFVSSFVCFGAGIVATAVLVSILRKRHARAQKKASPRPSAGPGYGTPSEEATPLTIGMLQ